MPPDPDRDEPDAAPTRGQFSIDELLEIVVQRKASDLHLTAGSAPAIRVHGRIERLHEFGDLTAEQSRKLLYNITSTEQQKDLEERRNIDLSYPLPGLARFRVNIFFQRESLAAAFRLVPTGIKPLAELGLPNTLYDLCDRPRGLIVVTGPTGSGKSTTLAALIDRINETRAEHIITVEDPIEFLHQHKRCIVNQREIGPDATSFADALRAALREDPDVILLGEMRDLETIATALTAAETGHLVFATVHTQDAPSAVDRIIDVFPAGQQGQIRVQVASTLQGVMTQNLLPTVDGAARVPAVEILIPDDAVRNLIRAGKARADLHQHADGLRQGHADHGAVAGRPRHAGDRHAGHGHGPLEPSAAVARAPPARPRLRTDGVAARQQATDGLGETMGREIVGLKIGASKIVAARVATNGSGRLLQLAGADLPPGLVVGGEVQDVEGLGAVLKQFFAEHKLPRRGVRVGVSSNRVGVRTIDVGGIDDPKQLGNAVRFRAQEALPIPINEAVLDYQVLGESRDDEGKLVRKVLFVVAYRDLVERYAVACKHGGLKLAGVDLEAFALLRAVTPFAELPADESERGAIVAVSVGSERSTLAVTEGTTCEFTRVLEWGGSALTTAIARDLGTEPVAAERIKRSLHLDSDETPEGLDQETAAKARQATLVGLQTFARELVSSLQFYQNQPGSLGIREIVLAGGTARLAGLAETLQRMVAVSVRIGDPLVNLAHGKKIKGGDPDPSHAIPIGLGMGA